MRRLITDFNLNSINTILRRTAIKIAIPAGSNSHKYVNKEIEQNNLYFGETTNRATCCCSSEMILIKYIPSAKLLTGKSRLLIPSVADPS